MKMKFLTAAALAAGLSAAAPAFAEDVTLKTCTSDRMPAELTVSVKSDLADKAYFLRILQEAFDGAATLGDKAMAAGGIKETSARFIKAQERDGKIMEPGAINVAKPGLILGGPACTPKK